MGTISCEIVPSNMVVGLGCHRKQQKMQWQLEEFIVLEILFNMAAKKKEIRELDGFEGLLRYYLKLTAT